MMERRREDNRCPDCGGEVLTDGTTMWCAGTCGMVQTMPGQLLHAAQMDEIRAALLAGFEPVAPGDGPSQPHRGASLLQLAKLAASHMRSARAERDALQTQVAALNATVDGLLARTRVKPPAEHHGTGDVWAAIIAELPEGAARDLAVARRDLGIARYGVPLGLRDLDTAQRDLREELLDAVAYGVEVAALLTAEDPDDPTADVVVFRAAEAYASATGLFYPKAIGRAVRKLARGVR